MKNIADRGCDPASGKSSNEFAPPGARKNHAHAECRCKLACALREGMSARRISRRYRPVPKIIIADRGAIASVRDSQFGLITICPTSTSPGSEGKVDRAGSAEEMELHAEKYPRNRENRDEPRHRKASAQERVDVSGTARARRRP